MTRPPHEQPPSGAAPDDLQRAYRRASGLDESRPSDRVRAAILEHAHRVAGKPSVMVTATGVDTKAPAANDPRWNLRAVAGLAAIGLAGVLAVVLYRGNPDPQPVPTVTLQAEAPMAERREAPALVPTEPEQEAARESRTSRARSAVPAAESPGALAAAPASDIAPAAEAAAETAADVGTAASAPLASVVTAAQESVPVAAMRSEKASAAVADAANAGIAPAALVAPPVATVVGRYFPQALDSEQAGQQYWALMSRDGRVLRSGQRSAGDDSDLVAFVESSFAGVRAGEVQRREFVNQRGLTLSVVYVYLAEGSPPP